MRRATLNFAKPRHNLPNALFCGTIPDNMISIKGLRQGLLIVFDESDGGPWLSQLFELERKLQANTNFFKGGRMALDVKGFSLGADDVARARALLSGYEVDLWAIIAQHAETRSLVRAAGLADTLADPPAPVRPKPAPAPDRPTEPTPVMTRDTAVETTGRGTEASREIARETAHEAVSDAALIEGTDGLLVRRRVRSGQVLRHPGHIVVIGDVNPGAQLIAGGDVIVWGKLHGSVHAGALGDTQATICALDLSPSLLKIADAARMARADKDRKKQRRPETATLHDQQIQVSEWQT